MAGKPAPTSQATVLTVAGDASRRRRLLWLVAAFAAGIGVAAVAYFDKAADHRSAFIRWIRLIQGLVAGENVYTVAAYPNPPLMALVLYPLTLLPPVAGAMVWFFLKACMALGCLAAAIRFAVGKGQQLPLTAIAVVGIVSIRPLLGDLQHGNVNILVVFVVLASLWCYRHRWDMLAGVGIALATTFKVTPALFIPYFAWKRQWRVVAGSMIGLLLFLIVIPGTVLGMKHNLVLLRSWVRLMVEPYVLRGEVETRQVNQSLPGVLYRLTTPSPGIEFEDDRIVQANVLNLSKRQAWWLLRALVAGILLWLAYICRTPTEDRTDWRLGAEFALILLAMLFLSERSWKHHYVSICVPVAVVTAHLWLRARSRLERVLLAGALSVTFLLMALTSPELAGWIGPGGYGHKYMQAGGAFFWAGVVLFCANSALLLQARRVSGAAGAGPGETVARCERDLGKAA